MKDKQNYDTMSKAELVQSCIKKDSEIDEYIRSLENSQCYMLDKTDIMKIYKCENGKALKILKLMFQMGYGNKIGKEYYISPKSQEKFVKDMAGKQVYI